MVNTTPMTSNRPYLLRALYEWINDNNLTPYVLADANAPGIQVPKSAIKSTMRALTPACGVRLSRWISASTRPTSLKSASRISE